jgi:EAL domain-containing protein (putative c-di-GMP-specific phosphodiesterase class I)
MRRAGCAVLGLLLMLSIATAHAQQGKTHGHVPWPLMFNSKRLSELAQLASLSGAHFHISTRGIHECAVAPCAPDTVQPASSTAKVSAESGFELHLPYLRVARFVIPSPRLSAMVPDNQTLLRVLSILFWPALLGLFILLCHLSWQRWFRYERKMERAAKAGLARGEFHMEYQPLVSIRGRACVGMDALLRWANPDFGKIGSTNYMAVLEQCSWISSLMRFALARVAQEIGELSEARPLYVIVDITVSCFESEGFLRRLIEIVTKENAHWIVVGLNHKAVAGAEKMLSGQMAYARSKGVSFALTGLGADAGSASFPQPQALSFEIIKVDRRLFALAPPLRMKRLQTLAAAAREMDAMLIVDGVDTVVHHDVVRSVGGELGQGFFYSRPLAMRRLKSFLQGSERARSM